MKKMRRSKADNFFISRLLALTLTLTMILACIPITGNAAGKDPDKVRVFEIMEDGSEKEIDPASVPSPDEIMTERELEKAVSEKLSQPGVQAQGTDSTVKTMKALPSDVTVVDIDKCSAMASDSKMKTDSLVTGKGTPSFYTYYDQRNGTFRVMGTVSGDTFDYIEVDGDYEGSLSDKSYMDYTIDMKYYDVGYHTVYITLGSGAVYYKQYVATMIYDRPTNYVGNYDVYSNYFTLYTSSNYYYKDYSCSLYMDLRQKGKKWGTYGPMADYKTYRKSGLKAKTTYQSRLYYGKLTSYNGKYYFFKGSSTGYTSGVVTFKTGQKKKPKVKSIKVKAKNLKKHRIRYISYWTGRTLYTVTYYTYKLKASIKLKKKPKAKGIVFNGFRLKGNKKNYSKNLGSYATYQKPKGKKLTVTLYSYMNNTYGGYSPMYKKKVRIK